MRRVGVIGAGLIGRSWAIVFARAGWSVRMTDSSAPALEAAPAFLSGALDDLAQHGLIENPVAAAARVTITDNVTEAVAAADLVQECGPETVADKTAIYAKLDVAAPPQAVLASSTSAIMASKFTRHLAGRARCLVAHPVNPPHLVPLVELCPAPWTSRKVVLHARALYESVGQQPIVLRREVEGFVLNRLQGALLAEAFRLVGGGYVSAADLDRTIKHGLGLRWSFMGPFETIELNAPGGIADYCQRYAAFYKRLQADAAPPSVYGARNIERLIRAWGARLGKTRHIAKTRWRDRRLAALIAHKQTQREFE